MGFPRISGKSQGHPTRARVTEDPERRSRRLNNLQFGVDLS